MGTQGRQLLLLANREGFLEEVASEPPLEREPGRMLGLGRNGRWARLALTRDYPTIPHSSVMINGKPSPSQDPWCLSVCLNDTSNHIKIVTLFKKF